MKNLKIGDTLIMNFHFMGITSKEEEEIMDINENTVSLHRSDDEVWVFDLKTGKCLNDNTYMGAYRTIEPKTH